MQNQTLSTTLTVVLAVVLSAVVALVISSEVAGATRPGSERPLVNEMTTPTDALVGTTCDEGFLDLAGSCVAAFVVDTNVVVPLCATADHVENQPCVLIPSTPEDTPGS